MRIYLSKSYPDSFNVCVELLKKRAKSLDYRHTVIVPDRHTLEAEKIIMDSLNENGSFDVEVLTFSRLSAILTRTNGKQYLSHDGAVMVAAGILESKKQQLQYFGKSRNKRGAAKEILSAVNQILSCGINPLSLHAGDGTLLKRKLDDIGIFYREYRQFLKDGNYSDSQSIIFDAAKAAGQSDFIKNRTFYITGFDAVPHSFLSLLGQIAVSSEIIFSIIYYDKAIGGTELKNCIENHPSFKNTLLEFVPVPDSFSGVKKRLMDKFYSPHMSFSDETAFGDGGKNAEQSSALNKNDGRITLHRSLSRSSQAESVARTIAHYCYNGVRFSDIGILGALTETDEAVFAEYGIPLNIDTKRKLSQHPYIRFLTDYFLAVQNNCRINTVLDIVYNYFSGIQRKDAEAFDNYALEFSIDYNRIMHPFSLGRYDDDGKPREDFFAAEKVREGIAANIIFLKSCINECRDYDGFINVCRDFLDRFDATCAFDRSVDLSYHAYSVQVKAKVDLVFCNLSLSMGRQKTDVEEFFRILKNGLDACEISVTPPRENAVTVTDADGFRIKRYKAVFWINANQGILPAHFQDTGILSDKDIDKLREFSHIEPKICEINDRAGRALFNTVFCCDNLHIFYCAAINGKKSEKSGFVAKLCTVGEILESVDTNTDINSRLTKLTPIQAAGRYPSKKAAGVRACETYFACKKTGAHIDGGTAAVLTLNGFSLKTAECKTLSETDSYELFFGSGSTSVSQLEAYFSCPFAHFLKYGLRCKRRKEGGLQGFDFGNAIHEAVEKFAEALDSVTRENCAETVGRIVGGIFEKYDIFKQDTTKNHAAKSIILRESQAVCSAIFEAGESSEFRIAGVEKKFASDGDFAPLKLMTSGGNLDLNGKIDRIDVCGKNLIVADYKTGHVSAEISDVYFGKKIQLFIYLKALENAGFTPYGALYMPVNNDYARAGGRERFSYIGWLVNDAQETVKLDKNLSLENPKSKFFPISLYSNKDVKKSGEIILKNTNTMLSREEFDGALDYAVKVASVAAEEICQGNIAKSPFTNTDLSPCEYCEGANCCLQKQYTVREWKNAVAKNIFVKPNDESTTANDTADCE